MSQQDAKLQNCNQKFKELVASIVDLSSSDESSECERFIDQCEQSLDWLKRATSRERKANDEKSITECPREFLCPISKEIMANPVIDSSGVTYDKGSFFGNLEHESALLNVSNVMPVPNVLILEMIMAWCCRNGCGPFEYSNVEVLIDVERRRLGALCENIGLITLPGRRRAAQLLRALTCYNKSHCMYFKGSPIPVSRIVKALLLEAHNEEGFEEDLLYTIFYIASHEETKGEIGQNTMLLIFLANGLKPEKSETIRSICVSTLKLLSCVESFRGNVGQSGAVKALLGSLKRGDTVIEKDATTCLNQLCEHPKNVERVVVEGGVEWLYENISNGHSVVEMIKILSKITKNAIGSLKWGNKKGVNLLGLVLKAGDCSKETVQDCMQCLLNVYDHYPNSWDDINQNSELATFIASVAADETLDTKGKARKLSKRINNRHPKQGN